MLKSSCPLLRQTRRRAWTCILLSGLAFASLSGCDGAEDESSSEGDPGTDLFAAYILCADVHIDQSIQHRNATPDEAIKAFRANCDHVRERYLPHLFVEVEAEIGRPLSEREKESVIQKFDADNEAELRESIYTVYGVTE